MNLLRRRACAALACAVLAPAFAKDTKEAAFRTIGWDALLPKDWDPWADFQGAGVDLRRLSDDDPRAAAALQRLRKVWDEAPLVAALDGAAIRIPGYVVPLETTAQGLRELLLVPHFGACIHTPPPPANQIVHVRLDKPHKSLGTMDTVWISGRLQLARASTVHGVSGYALAGQRVERYAAPAR
ncbi:MAG: DUF3299 domain-containing protein [Variovorax paradoxus]|nr:MAG: DUF3299 domain-containing protein [Variovorax paradoxus]PZQ04813.1 MAG: DUF3299 domain-containing protein [Variovorax paradoxus]